MGKGSRPQFTHSVAQLASEALLVVESPPSSEPVIFAVKLPPSLIVENKDITDDDDKSLWDLVLLFDSNG